MSVRSDVIGKTFGEWKVLGYGTKNRSSVVCKCSCGVEKEVNCHDLVKGKSKSCGHNTNKQHDLTGKTFGYWEVIEYAGGRKWKCRCSRCGKISNVNTQYLLNGNSKSCGCRGPKFEDLTGMTFGELEAIRYTGNGKWLCKCSCGKELEVYASNLRSGGTRSCGCRFYQNGAETRIKSGATRHRSREQINILSCKESFRNYLIDLETEIGYKPNVNILMDRLNISQSQVLLRIHDFEVEYLVDLSGNRSGFEEEVYKHIKDIYSGEVERNKRGMIGGNNEIDIYIPEKHIGIECNGAYWHSEKFLDKKKHIEKTINAMKNGIAIIHIFDFEWKDSTKRDKLKAYINGAINGHKIRIYARNTTIREISNKDAIEFCNQYHLQSGIVSRICLGLYENNELIQVMTFGSPRFNSKYQYELLRLCTKENIVVIGGANKLMRYFISVYKPESIISYCNISKFNGGVYEKLGFKNEGLSEPNYIWFRCGKVVSRYDAQKHKLIANGLGDESQTESDIMHSLGYLKVHDCGNIKFCWENNSNKE